MGKVRAGIDDSVRRFIAEQHVFFVATAPSVGGHVNLSPKGLDTFAVLGPSSVAWLDLTGSGVETIAHLRENGRITIMFCAFEGRPRIVRLSGPGEVVVPGEPSFDGLVGRFPPYPGVRSVIRVEVDRVADSCGFGVPLYRYEGERGELVAWAERKGPDGLVEYRREKNAASVDGLPGW
jgi:hypothetical protein